VSSCPCRSWGEKQSRDFSVRHRDALLGRSINAHIRIYPSCSTSGAVREVVVQRSDPLVCVLRPGSHGRCGLAAGRQQAGSAAHGTDRDANSLCIPGIVLGLIIRLVSSAGAGLICHRESERDLPTCVARNAKISQAELSAHSNLFPHSGQAAGKCPQKCIKVGKSAQESHQKGNH
jgi:hypothetical protein